MRIYKYFLVVTLVGSIILCSLTVILIPIRTTVKRSLRHVLHTGSESFSNDIHGQNLDYSENLRKQWAFLKDYQAECAKVGHVTARCPCIPRGLQVSVKIRSDSKIPTWQDMTSAHHDVRPGGQWEPSDCQADQRVAIIIPYRDREEHLKQLLHHTIPIWKRQQLAFTIVVAEQAGTSIFNKALIMNAAFLETEKLARFDCFIFHDVDMLLESDLNLYKCRRSPVHLGVYLDKFDYRLKVWWIVGGVSAVTSEQFRRVNGYSNRFYGWGGEDNDFYNRIKDKNMSIIRYPREIARYTMIQHASDKGNKGDQYKQVLEKLKVKNYDKEGLNTANYTLVKTEKLPLYTRLLVAI